MVPRHIVGVILIALLIIGLLSIGASAGWSQGYRTGLIAAGGEGTPLPPHAFYGLGFSPLFFGLGLFFKIGFFLFIFLVIAKFFRFWAWRRGWGPFDGPWPKDKHGPGGPKWPWDWGESSEKTKSDGDNDDFQMI